MALGEGKLQLIDLLGLAQLADKRDYGDKNYYNQKRLMELQQEMSNNAAADYRRSPEGRDEQRKRNMELSMQQSKLLGATEEPTIMRPGMDTGLGNIGGYSVPVSSIPGMVGGLSKEQYGQQVHEGLMQTGKLMSEMAIAAADANAGVSRGGGGSQSTWKQQTDFIENQQRKKQSPSFGDYPLQEQGMKQQVLDNSTLGLLRKAAGGQQKSWNDEYDQMAKDRKVESQIFNKAIGDIEKQRPQEIAMGKEIAKTNTENIKQQTDAERVQQLQTTLTGDVETDKETLRAIAKIAGVTVPELINHPYYKSLQKK